MYISVRCHFDCFDREKWIDQQRNLCIMDEKSHQYFYKWKLLKIWQCEFMLVRHYVRCSTNQNLALWWVKVLLSIYISTLSLAQNWSIWSTKYHSLTFIIEASRFGFYWLRSKAWGLCRPATHPDLIGISQFFSTNLKVSRFPDRMCENPGFLFSFEIGKTKGRFILSHGLCLQAHEVWAKFYDWLIRRPWLNLLHTVTQRVKQTWPCLSFVIVAYSTMILIFHFNRVAGLGLCCIHCHSKLDQSCLFYRLSHLKPAWVIIFPLFLTSHKLNLLGTADISVLMFPK